MPKGKAFLLLSLSFVGGIFVNSFFVIPQIMLWGLFILGLIGIVVLWRNKGFVVVGVCVMLFVAGAYRHGQALDTVSELAAFNERGKVMIRGIISKEPDVRIRSTQLTVSVREIIAGGERLAVSGNILVATARYPEYQYGDELEIIGELRTPAGDLEGFNYRKYLEKDGVYSTMYLPKIEKISEGKGNPFIARILIFKDALRKSIYRAIPPPESEILGAILLGDKRKLSDGLVEKLNITGTRHITAISGMHIAILSSLLLAGFLAIGFWRHHAFYASILVLTSFIIMVGAPPSAIRAGVMGGALLLAENIGRPKSAYRAIVYAALIMLLLNPMLLRFDVGFQLSFLAVMGIAVFRDWGRERFRFLPDILQFRSVAAMTVAAQLATLPILMFNFGRVSLVSFFANILIVPFVPFVMAGGLFSGIAGIVFTPLGRILSWPVWLILKYVTFLVDFFAGVPFASITAENVHWLWMVPYYLLLFRFYKKHVQYRALDK